MAVNMTSQSIPVKQDWTRNASGEYVGDVPSGTPTSGGDDALGFSAPNGLVDGNALTITTDGTYSFGATGPEIVVLMDAADYAVGRADGTEIRQGSAALTLTGGDFNVESDANLPAGKGWQVGAGHLGSIIRCDHTQSTRIFESSTYYYSSQNIENSRALDGGGYQMKPIWNFSHNPQDSGTTAIDFFTTRPCVNALVGSDRRPHSYLSSNSVGTTYFTNTNVDDPADANNYPYSVPYTAESLWDQGSADGVTNDASLDYFCTASNGLALSKSVTNGLLLTASGKDTNIVKHFTYPGYFLGLAVADDCHLLDTELYRAVGAGAACRVAITNHADYFQASKRTVLWTSSWANGAVEVELRSGWFDLSDTSGLYINLINAANVQIGSIAL